MRLQILVATVPCTCICRPATELAAAPICCLLLPLRCCLCASSCCFERLWPKPWLPAGRRFRGLRLFLGEATAAAEDPAAALLSRLHSRIHQSSTISQDLLHLILHLSSNTSHTPVRQHMQPSCRDLQDPISSRRLLQTSQNAPLPMGLCKFRFQLCTLLLPALSFIAQHGSLLPRSLHLLVPVPVPPQHLIHLGYTVRTSRSTEILLPSYPRDCLKKVMPKYWLGVLSEAR